MNDLKFTTAGDYMKTNERILELERQARQLAQEAVDQKKYNTYSEYQQSLSDQSYAKFAELIVFECVKAVMDGTKEGDHYAQRIEQHFDNGTGGILHFGVEE